MHDNRILLFSSELIGNQWVISCLNDTNLGFMFHRRYNVEKRIKYMLRRAYPDYAAFPVDYKSVAYGFAIIHIEDVKAGLERMKEIEARMGITRD